jgi:hypothetical protein
VSGCFRPISCLSSDRMARFGLPAPAQPERRPEGDIMPIGVVLIRSSTRRRVAALRRPCPGLRAERSAQGLLRATPIGVLGVLAMLASPACGGAASLRVTTEAGAGWRSFSAFRTPTRPLGPIAGARRSRSSLGPAFAMQPGSGTTASRARLICHPPARLGRPNICRPAGRARLVCSSTSGRPRARLRAYAR